MYNGACHRVASLARNYILQRPDLKTVAFQFDRRLFATSNSTMASNRDAHDKHEIKKRDVAGSFLFRYPDGDESKAQVALFRRSGAVRTYQYELNCHYYQRFISCTVSSR